MAQIGSGKDRGLGVNEVFKVRGSLSLTQS